MTSIRDLQHNIPCDTCIHNNVCNVRKCFEETKIDTTHPFVVVELKCTEYLKNEFNRGALR